MPGSFSELSQIAIFVSGLDWRGGAREVLTRSTDIFLKNVAESYAKEFLENETCAEKLPGLLVEVGPEIAGAIASIVGIGVIKAIWKQNDAAARQLNRLLRGPFIAGTRMANEALELPYTNDEEQAFRDNRFNAAIDELDRAWGLLRNPGEVSIDRFTITLLQGQCASHCTGGKRLAVRRLGECGAMIDRVLDENNETCDRLDSIKYQYRYGVYGMAMNPSIVYRVLHELAVYGSAAGQEVAFRKLREMRKSIDAMIKKLGG